MSHWYNERGDTVYTVPRADGKGERDTTMRDARVMNLFPSVTTLFQQLSKPGLDIWKQEQLLNAVEANIPNSGYSSPSWRSSVVRASKEISESASKLGAEIHDELEKWYKLGGDTPPTDRIASAVFEVRDVVGKYDYVAEKSFTHQLGFGGKVDLHSDQGIVLDFKTKNTVDVKKMVGYTEHKMQLAAYRNGLGIPNAKCYNLFISAIDPKIVKLVEYKEEEIEKAWEMFKCLLRFWQLSNNFEVRV